MSGAAPHKPRRKTKRTANDGSTDRVASSSSSSPKLSIEVRRHEALVREPAFPLAAFLWPARGSGSQWAVLPLTLLVAALFRWAAGLWGYSGYQRPPMHGDYEAQRHWMEVTTQLPVSQWYFHDLQWWGLDYPPLTAYHSWLLGTVGAWINPSWFALYTSRRLDDLDLKVFMRATVLVSEYVVYVPAAVLFVRRYSRLHGVSAWTASVGLAAFLMQPATMLIDHVHFQYNTVMLGLTLASMSDMMVGKLPKAAVFFVAALAFKQMALYYSFPVFFYLLGSCVFPCIAVGRLLRIALATAVAGVVLLSPLIIGTLYDVRRGIDSRSDLDGPRPPLPLFPELAKNLDTEALYYPVVEQLLQLVFRIFPFARGLFEDKVANFWCALNVVIKLRDLPPALLQRAALGATLLSTIPPNLVLFFKPSKTLIPWAFATTAWGFFLFSYQVHEKSVLLPLMPMTLLLCGHQGLSGHIRSWVGFANMLGVWTMFPLLRRVELAVPYATLTLLWAYLVGLPPTSLSAYIGQNPQPAWWVQWSTATIHGAFYLAMGAWHVAEAFVVPPPGKPDLWVVANVGIGAAGFVVCYVWCFGMLVVESGILGGVSSSSSSGTTAKTKNKTS